jgi:hypothetical protein
VPRWASSRRPCLSDPLRLARPVCIHVAVGRSQVGARYDPRSP